MLKITLLLIVFNGWYSSAVAQVTEEICLDEINKGNTLLWHFSPHEALEQYSKAMHIAKEIEADSLYALAQFGAGQAIWYKGDFTNAIYTIQTALQQFRKIKDQYNTTAALRILSNIYDDMGDYENAFKTVMQALEIFKNYDDDQNEVLSLIQMGTLYKSIGDYETAMGYYETAINKNPHKGEYPYRELYHRIGELYTAREKIDSARYFYQKAFTGNRNSKTIRICMGETYLIENKTERAFAYYAPLLTEARNTNDVNIQIPVSLGLAKIYLVHNDLSSALRLAGDALDMSTQRGQRQNKRDAYELLSTIYEAEGNLTKALQYEKLFQKLKDSVITDRFKGQLYSFKQKATESEQLAALQAQKRVTLWSLIFICLAGVLVFVLITLRHKNEKLHLKQRASDLEMQALRAQMNPHFVFNCLTAINHFVLANETDSASQYLTRFSRLLRMVLINAGKATITLEEEIAILRLYLDMEQLRFKEAFNYTISYDEAVQPSMVSVPSFILQPFCENAIWHGLLHKEGKGQLNIHCKIEENALCCTITDNGVGREKSTERKIHSIEQHSSFGQKLSAERLDLFNGKKGEVTSFMIKDMKDEMKHSAGTMVILKIKQSYRKS